MTLELSDRERDLLVQLLSTHSRIVHLEMRQASAHEFKDELKLVQATVDSLLDKLNALKMAA
jgi:hypothetical protein